MVRQAVGSAIPPERKKQERKLAKIGPVKECIDSNSGSGPAGTEEAAAYSAPDLATVAERDAAVFCAESTVREYVRQRKREMGLAEREVFVPQSYAAGQEGQVDWFEAQVKLHGEARKLQFFAMRSMSSGGAFHRAYFNAARNG